MSTFQSMHAKYVRLIVLVMIVTVVMAVAMVVVQDFAITK